MVRKCNYIEVMKYEVYLSGYLLGLVVYECVVPVRSGLRIDFTQVVKIIVGLEEFHAKERF